jgi:hypothetical protein
LLTRQRSDWKGFVLNRSLEPLVARELVAVARAVVDSAGTVAAVQTLVVALAAVVSEEVALAAVVSEVEAYSSEANMPVSTIDRVDDRLLFDSIHEAFG